MTLSSMWTTTILLLLVLSHQGRGQGSGADPTNDYSCSLDKPCQLGCCGKSFYCGFGPDFCGVGNCISDCDRKSECDPGWGAQWSNATSCPLNVCCSQYGFCGTTQDFCGNKTVTRPSCTADCGSAKQRVVGYYEAWNIQRCCDQRFPQDLYMGAWTHLNFAFAYIDPTTFEVVAMDPLDVQLYKKFTGLKNTYPNLQTWISIGGWSMNDPGPYNTTFSNLAASPQAMAQFSNSLISFMNEYGFDGVDIDWEYPVADERAGQPEDFQNYVTWLTQLKQDLNGGYGLTITIPSSYWYMRHFDITNLIDQVDWFNVMTYDLHGTWDGTNPYVGPYVDSHTNVTEINQALDLLWRNNIDPQKVSMGLGFYGRSFTLANPSCAQAGCMWSSGGDPGACTKNSGTLSFAEVDDVIQNDNPVVTYDTTAMVNQVVWDSDQWVSFDDGRAFSDKYAFANSRCLGGLLVWAATLDTEDGKAHGDLCAALGCTCEREGYVEPPYGCGTTCTCNRWHTVYEGDSCYAIYTSAGLTYDQFRALNPEIDDACSNLKLGYQYCTDGEPAEPDLSTCQPEDTYHRYYEPTTSGSTDSSTTTEMTTTTSEYSTALTSTSTTDIPSTTSSSSCDTTSSTSDTSSTTSSCDTTSTSNSTSDTSSTTSSCDTTSSDASNTNSSTSDLTSTTTTSQTESTTSTNTDTSSSSETVQTYTSTITLSSYQSSSSSFGTSETSSCSTETQTSLTSTCSPKTTWIPVGCPAHYREL